MQYSLDSLGVLNQDYLLHSSWTRGIMNVHIYQQVSQVVKCDPSILGKSGGQTGSQDWKLDSSQ